MTGTRIARSVAACSVVAAMLACVAGDALAQAPRTARIGYLTPAAQAERETAFRDELAKLGWVEGRNLVIEYRNANGFARLPALAEELARMRVDVIVSFVTEASLAAKAATRTTPIVMVAVADPLGSKLVDSLGRPGGNVTGTSLASVDVIGKQLELLREVRPGLERVAVLFNPANPVFNALQVDEAKAAAARLGLALAFVEAQRPEAIEPAFATIARARAQALLVLADPVFSLQAARLAQLSLEHRLPAMGAFAPYAEAGLLIAYGARFEDMVRRAAVYVDRILEGAKPADLPVERPTSFELVVNTTTAQALGIAIPPSVAARTTRFVP